MGTLSWYFAFAAAMSLVAFVAYGFDKHQAGIGGRRVPEQTLHALALLGGWPGALAGQRFFRHKTRKLSFQILFWLVVLAHLACLGLIWAAVNLGHSVSVGKSQKSPTAAATRGRAGQIDAPWETRRAGHR